MYNKIDLKNKLESIHRKSYPAYKSLRGSYTFGDHSPGRKNSADPGSGCDRVCGSFYGSSQDFAKEK